MTTLAEQQAKDRNDALRAYARICKRTDRPEAGDSKELARVLRMLDIATDEFDADVAAFKSMADMTAEADQYEGLRKVAKEAGRRVQANQRESEDTAKRLEAEWRELVNEHNTANYAAMKAKTAVEYLQRTRERHARVFDPPMPTVSRETARALSRTQAAHQETRREAKRVAKQDAAAAAAQKVVVATEDE